MSNGNVKCPNCGHEFALNEAILAQYENDKQQAVQEAIKTANKKQKAEIERLQAEYEARQEEIKAKTEQEVAERLAESLKSKDETIVAMQKKIEEARKAGLAEGQETVELKLKEKELELERLRRQFQEMERRVTQGSIELGVSKLKEVAHAF